MRKSPHIGRIGVVTGFAIIAPVLLHADAPAPPPCPAGYHLVPIHSADGSTAYIRAPDAPTPNARLSSSTTDGKYDPTQLDLGKTSGFSGKSFVSPSFTQSDSAEVAREQNFITKSYFGDQGNAANLTEKTFDTKTAYPNANTEAYAHPAAGVDKTFATDKTSDAQGQTAQFASAPLAEQHKTANIGGQKIDSNASPLASKTYLGPEADLEKHSMAQVNQDLMQLKDLPNRPLSIDEVRNLINHGTKPDTDSPPPPPTKALNDPGYQPEETAPPVQNAPVDEPDAKPAPPPAETSDDDFPAPGVMAARHQAQGQAANSTADNSGTPVENSEPLPK